MGVAVMGVGMCGAFPASDGLSYRELIARAAQMAYRDAGIVPSQLDGAVSVEEDFVSGYSIADEYVPDQLGVARKPVYTICGDFLHGFGSAVMQIETGRFETVVVEAYSKASNVLHKDELLHFAFDPVMERLGLSPHYLAALEMQHFLAGSGFDLADVAEVARRNREVALDNPLAPYGGRTTVEDILEGRPVALPLTEPMIARHADAAVVVVLGTDAAARRSARKPVFVAGTGWGSASSIVARRDLSCSEGTEVAAGLAFAESGIEDAAADCDVFYVSDLLFSMLSCTSFAVSMTVSATSFAPLFTCSTTPSLPLPVAFLTSATTGDFSTSFVAFLTAFLTSAAASSTWSAVSSTTCLTSSAM
jgi:acetyl-CoA C-acetyltransferase